MMYRALFLVPPLFLWACGEESKESDIGDETPTDSGSDSASDTTDTTLEEIRLAEYAADLGTAYSMESMSFGEDTNHTLTVYMFDRHSSAEVHAPDRGMTRFVFFWNADRVAAQVIDLGAEYYYNYWWEGDRYDVSFEIIDAEFANTEYAFELNGKTETVTELRAGVAGMNFSEMEENACRFSRDMLRFAWESMERRIGDGEC
ncbi:MAG: hypothetical protein VX278_07375, partial [Myxococcota bacterium]|nr:hypothetical protein [Myxococcota bacterium]